MTYIKKTNYWALVPAAGIGVRMDQNTPKQYQNLLGKPLICHTLERLLAVPSFKKIVVALHPEDNFWQEIKIFSNERILTVVGGAMRCDSVINGLKEIGKFAKGSDWVVVHDAARPCIGMEDISLLMDSLKEDSIGGILATPVRDTLKRINHADQTIQKTEDRSCLWHALTPQMFRLQLLQKALMSNEINRSDITDESSAIERLGYAPKIIRGSSNNLKVTTTSDIKMAEFFLKKQQDRVLD